MATFTVANGGGNINVAATYVGGVGVPGAADTIVFTTTSGQLTVNVSTTLLDIDFSNYKNVITFNAPLSVSRNITFGDAGGNATYTVAGTNALVKTGTGNLTANGKTWTGNFTFGSGTYTITLMDLCVFSNTINFANNNTVTLNSNNVLDPERFNVTGDFTLSGGGALIGTALIKFTGTSNQTLAAATLATIRVNIKIDKTGGTLTFTGSLNYNTGIFTYIQGNTNTGTSTLIISTATTTMNTNGSSTSGATVSSSTGINWYNVTLSTTLSLTSNFTVINTLTANVGTITRAASENVYLGGNLTMTSTLTSTAATIIMNGTGTWSGSGVVTAPLTINTTGTITISGSVGYSTRTLTYNNIGGSVVTTGSTLNINATCTLNTNGITWNNFTILGTNPTITLSSNVNITGTLTFGLTSGTLNFTTGGNSFNATGDLSLVSGTINLPNDLTVVNATLGVTTANPVMNLNTVYISGNLTTINTGDVSGTTNLVLNGTGTWSNTSTGIIQLNLEINTLGTITIGSVVYYSTKILTYTSGTVDVTTNNSTLAFTNTSTFNNNGIVLNNLSLSTNSAILTLNSDLTCLGQITLGQGGKTITGASNINCNSFRFANNISAGYIYNFNSCIIYTNDLLLEGAISGSAFNLSNGTFYVNRDLYVTGGVGHAGHYYGNSNIIMTGTGVLSTTSGLTAPLTINTSGKITVSSILYLGAQGPSGSGGTTFTYLRGNVIANKSKLSLEIQALSTYILNNMNKIVWGSVGITSGMTITMNEFFCGDAYTQTNITTTSTTNATVTFTDNFEKIAKFVNMNGVTFARPQQLLLITNQPKKSRNIGIRYNNQSPNGISKGDSSIQNQQTVGQSRTLLLGDPAFVKSI